MRIFVKVKPGAKKERVEKIDEDHYALWVKEPPEQGRANEAVIKILAQHLQKSPSLIKIVSGRTSRQKVIELGEA